MTELLAAQRRSGSRRALEVFGSSQRVQPGFGLPDQLIPAHMVPGLQNSVLQSDASGARAKNRILKTWRLRYLFTRERKSSINHNSGSPPEGTLNAIVWPSGDRANCRMLPSMSVFIAVSSPPEVETVQS
jgi:hypothetical protein